MAQFLPDNGRDFRRKIIDFVDVDSDKWQQYAERKPWPLSWVYRREARCLLALEQELAERFDAGLFVSSTEADLFHRLSPATAHKIGFYNNGVNGDYFAPDFDREAPQPSPFPADSLPLVFTGAMDYWPNVDAVVWFVREVLPMLRRDHPQADADHCRRQSRPRGAAAGARGRRGGYRARARCAPLPQARLRGAGPHAHRPRRAEQGAGGHGHGAPVLVSRKGLEGIAAGDGEEVLLAESAADYRRLLGELIRGEHDDLGPRARRCVLQRFSWDENLPEVVFLLGQDDAVPRYVQAARDDS